MDHAELMSKLRVYLETECGLIADPESVLSDSINVLRFFKQHLELNEPQATNSIASLDMAIDDLESFELGVE